MAAARQRPLHGVVRARHPRALAVPGRRLARPPRHVAPRHGAEAGGRRRRRRRPRRSASRLVDGRAGRGRRRRRRRPQTAARPAGRAATRRRCTGGPATSRPTGDGRVPDLDDVAPDDHGPDDLDRLFWRAGLRRPLAAARPTRSASRSTSSGPDSARWYEFFPRSTVDRPEATPRWPTPSTGSTSSPRWASTSSTCRRSTRSARPTARAATTPPRPAPGDVGSPWAIGAPEGGHLAVHPDLGTVDDVAAPGRGVRAPRPRAGPRPRLPVHARPPVGHASTPTWFAHRPDGTIQYAENPPKKYQDIYPHRLRERRLGRPVGGARRRRPVLDRPGRHDLPRRQPPHQGVRVLGVDDRRPSGAEHPEVIFLAEAFTRPRVMERLAKIGFNQSYTYFTWRQSRWELQRVPRGPVAGAPSTTSGPTSGRTRPTSSPSSCRRADRRCSPAGRCSPPRCRRRGASTARPSS